MSVFLSLELGNPRLRPNAFPWGVAEVKLMAVISTSAGQRITTRVDLPCVVELSSAMLQNTGSAGGKALDDGTKEKQLGASATNLELEVVGCDHGVIFSVGAGILEVPTLLQPGPDQSSSNPDLFRLSLTDETRARVGLITGAFIARRQAVAPTAPPATPAIDTSSENVLPDKAPSERDDDREDSLESKIAALLDTTTNMLAASSGLSQTVRRRTGSRFYGSKSNGGHESRPNLQGQAEHFSILHNEMAEASLRNEAPTVGNSLEPGVVGSGNVQMQENPPITAPKTSVAADMSVRVPMANFRFEPTTGRVAWPRIASANVNKIERRGDVQTLKQFVADIAVGRVDGDDIEVNPGLMSAFRLAQLQTQYILHCNQVLERHCNGLRAAVTSMDLEVEGNAQASAGIKAQAHLLKKETRKQNKVVSGYAAMLRRHNPGLAAKVRLDDRGRLTVFDREEATREWEAGRRHRRRRRHKNKDGKNIGDQQVLALQRQVQVGCNGSRTSISPKIRLDSADTPDSGCYSERSARSESRTNPVESIQDCISADHADTSQTAGGYPPIRAKMYTGNSLYSEAGEDDDFLAGHKNQERKTDRVRGSVATEPRGFETRSSRRNCLGTESTSSDRPLARASDAGKLLDGSRRIDDEQPGAHRMNSSAVAVVAVNGRNRKTADENATGTVDLRTGGLTDSVDGHVTDGKTATMEASTRPTAFNEGKLKNEDASVQLPRGSTDRGGGPVSGDERAVSPRDTEARAAVGESTDDAGRNRGGATAKKNRSPTVVLVKAASNARLVTVSSVKKTAGFATPPSSSPRQSHPSSSGLQPWLSDRKDNDHDSEQNNSQSERDKDHFSERNGHSGNVDYNINDSRFAGPEPTGRASDIYDGTNGRNQLRLSPKFESSIPKGADGNGHDDSRVENLRKRDSGRNPLPALSGLSTSPRPDLSKLGLELGDTVIGDFALDFDVDDISDIDVGGEWDNEGGRVFNVNPSMSSS